MQHEILGLIALAISLLGTVIVTTWRSSAVTTELRMMINHLEQRHAEQDKKHAALEAIPQHETRLGHVEKNFSLLPAALERIKVLEMKAEFSKEMRSVTRSRPDFDK